jgi:hypothetical protein
MTARKPKKSRSKYHQVIDGEWYQIPMRNHFDQCCDCGLVHKLNFRINAYGKLEVQAFRHARATNGARSAFRFTKDY